MKRILKIGKNFNRVAIFQCHHCGCLFEANSEDYENIWLMGEAYHMSKCPCCGINVYGDLKDNEDQ